MGRAAANDAPADPKAVMEARRAAYREEQGLPDVKWSCFAEQRRHEDFAAVKFAQKQAALQAKNARPDRKVTDFVRRIRRVLDKKSREHGGTEGTYLRECFLNWDADCSGTIDAVEFRKAIRSLGLDISQADASYLVGYYGGVESAYTSVAKDEMTYDLLIEDVVNASIHFLQPQPPIPASARPDGPFPPVLRRFIKKVRQKLFTYITGKGENEQYLVRNAFLNWDKDASGSLSYDEFRNAMWQLNLAMSEEEAIQIVDLYDTSGKGEMRYEQLVKDVCAGVPHFTKQYDDPETIAKLQKLDRAEPTTRGKAHDDERMMQFMFTNRPLEKVPCQLAEEFKIRLKTALFAIMVKKGGTVTSILREAFQAWDQDSSGELNTKEFVGAIGRCGLQIDDATAHQLVNYYDRKGEQGRFGDGEIHYMDLVDELGKTCLHFMATAKANEFHDPTKPVEIETPKRVKQLVGQIRDSILKALPRASVQHGRKKKQVRPRDLLLGTCVRLDRNGSGMLDEKDMLRVFRDLRATLTEGGMRELLIWYGVDGSQRMPYQRLVDDCFPRGGTPVRTPPIKSPQQKVSQSSARKKLARIAAEKATIEKRLRELNAEARAL
mmetsp:Transcript_12564/g.33126  ORF Transcript_12564/g.33126 Transcript_12564/m.33126 type:complete len:607 (-) Transcript_12564:42-1862(-)